MLISLEVAEIPHFFSSSMIESDVLIVSPKAALVIVRGRSLKVKLALPPNGIERILIALKQGAPAIVKDECSPADSLPSWILPAAETLKL